MYGPIDEMSVVVVVCVVLVVGCLTDCWAYCCIDVTALVCVTSQQQVLPAVIFSQCLQCGSTVRAHYRY